MASAATPSAERVRNSRRPSVSVIRSGCAGRRGEVMAEAASGNHGQASESSTSSGKWSDAVRAASGVRRTSHARHARRVRRRREDVVEPHVRVPHGEGVAGLALRIRVQRPPRVDVAVGAHHLDRAARDVAAAQPDHAADPRRHRRRVEPLARRERVEVAGEHVERERVSARGRAAPGSRRAARAARARGAARSTWRTTRGGAARTRRGRPSPSDTSSSAWRVSRRVAPRVLEHGHAAEESRRVQTVARPRRGIRPARAMRSTTAGSLASCSATTSGLAASITSAIASARPTPPSRML